MEQGKLLVILLVPDPLRSESSELLPDYGGLPFKVVLHIVLFVVLCFVLCTGFCVIFSDSSLTLCSPFSKGS